ncbi:MAG: M48 family metallopeptidase [Acidobacteriota bacterium]|nr:M48 family metallopeptidase [Acidobacteriota bacterium]
MPVLAVADRQIPYEIRRSRRAKRLRIVVRPGRVEVVVPKRTWRFTIDSFVHANRRWIYEKTKRLEAREAAGEFSTEPQRYVSGARILFRGRRLRLIVESADVELPELTYKTAFRVQVPRTLSPGAREAAARACVDAWFAQRARADVEAHIRRYAPRLGHTPTAFRFKNQKTLWGSCSARGVISLNWRLVAAPKKILEYVVVHEICHLVERNHSPKFWRLVAALMPDYREHRPWLTRHGVALK